jgi:hypothetical protein
VNKTSTGLSTNIIITVNDHPVGAVQTLAIDEKRPLKMVDEVGTDGHIDSTPVSSTNITGSCKRIRFDRLRIAEAFGRAFVHAASQVYPFDIVILDKQKRNTASQISTVIKNVWIGGISYTYEADNWIISDNMTWEAETIFSFLTGSNGANATTGGQPVAVGGEIGIPNMAGPGWTKGGDNGSIANIEQMVDTGASGYRGSMDAAGIIDIGSDSTNPLF